MGTVGIRELEQNASPIVARAIRARDTGRAHLVQNVLEIVTLIRMAEAACLSGFKVVSPGADI